MYEGCPTFNSGTRMYSLHHFLFCDSSLKAILGVGINAVGAFNHMRYSEGY